MGSNMSSLVVKENKNNKLHDDVYNYIDMRSTSKLE